MTETITIPTTLTKMGELVVIPRIEYDQYLSLKKIVPIVEATRSEKKAMIEGRKQIKRGQFLTISELKNELGS